MIDCASLTPGRVAGGAYVELTTYGVEITPSTFAPLAAAARRNSGFADTLLMSVAAGVQPTFAAVTSAVMVGDGVAKITSVSAPADLSARICGVRLVCVASYDWALTIWLFSSTRPTRRPA